MDILINLLNNKDLLLETSGGVGVLLFLWIVLPKKKLKLVPELIPYKMHYKNARAVMSSEDWKKIALLTYKDSNFKCDICEATGRIECHEKWDFDDKNKMQKLVGLTTLCHDCHQVKHIGLAKKMGFFRKARKHMSKVNKVTEWNCQREISRLENYVKSQKAEYQLNLTYLNKFSNILPRQYSENENMNCRKIENNA